MNETFEEKFPELINKVQISFYDSGDGLYYNLIPSDDIEKHCLSRQKVRDAINKVFIDDGIVFPYGENPKKYLLKELGLE